MIPTFKPSDLSDPNGPGATDVVHYASRGAYETHKWFSTTSLLFAVPAAVVGARLGGVVGAGAGVLLGLYVANRTPPR